MTHPIPMTYHLSFITYHLSLTIHHLSTHPLMHLPLIPHVLSTLNVLFVAPFTTPISTTYLNVLIITYIDHICVPSTFPILLTLTTSAYPHRLITYNNLGRGGFGLVNACKRCSTGRLYAMKTLSKRRIKMKKAEALCMNERNILAIVQSPYVVCLKYAFTTVSEVFLVLDLMTGGDLGYHLSRKGRFLEKEACYYAARTLLGIAALHEKNIAYRDLKPENILMDEAGYTKISDLGLACKVGKSGLTGTCGT